MELLKQLKELENIQSVEQLKQSYSVEQLKDFYKKTEYMNKLNDDLFQKTIEKPVFSPEEVENLWKMKNYLTKMHLLLVKTIMAIEREQILENTVNLTEKLSRLIAIHPEHHQD